MTTLACEYASTSRMSWRILTGRAVIGAFWELFLAMITEHDRDLHKMSDHSMRRFASAAPQLVVKGRDREISLFNDPLKLEVVLSNTYDLWFAPWPSRSKSPAWVRRGPIRSRLQVDKMTRVTHRPTS